MLFSADHSESLLYLYFHEFYSEVARLKKRIASHGIATSSHVQQGDEDIDVRVTPAYIHQQLLPILERQRADAAQRGGEYGATLYREAQYLMAALTDEIFLHTLEWEGKEDWRSHLLETRLFSSYIAGDKVFKNLDTLLKESNPVYSDLARIYLIALSLGFKGKYRKLPEEGQLERYKHQLYSFITQNNPERLHEYLHFNPDKHLFPDTYAYTINEEKRKSLPSLFPWAAALAASLAILLVISYFLWHHHTDPLHQMTEQIFQLQEQ